MKDYSDIPNFLEANGILTGSRALDIHESSSDYDYVLRPEDYCEIKGMVKSSGLPVKPSQYYKGFYIDIPGEGIYNIFMSSREEYKAWIFSTKIMARLCKDSEYKAKLTQDKSKRIQIFEVLRAMLKGL